MKNFRDYDRSQPFLLPPDLRDWVADDDLAHFIVAAVERVDVRAFHVNHTGAGKAQYHPRMMLALLIYCYASGIFSSRRIERASYRNLSVRFITANTHPDHDTIATFRRRNQAAFEAAFAQVLLLAGESGLMKVGTVSVDGTKIDASASKVRSLRYDRIQALRSQLERDIAALMARAEAADASCEDDGLSLPEEITRRQALKAKLDAAARRLEEAAAAAGRDDDKGNGGGGARESGDDPDPPPEPAPEPAPETQTNLTDPDSALMRKSVRHEYRQAYNAQAVVDADGSQLVLATNVLATPNDREDFIELIDHLCETLARPQTLLADAGYASEAVVGALKEREIDPLIAVSRPERRAYDFRPPPDPAKPPPQIRAEWRKEMQAKLETEEAKRTYRRRKSTIEPVFGVIKSILGFTRFHLRGLDKVKTEWTLVTLAWNCKRLSKLAAA